MMVVGYLINRSGLKSARAAARRQEWQAATASYARMLRRQPDSTRLWIQYGHALKESGQAEQAEIAYRNAAVRQPDNVDCYRQLAFFLRRFDRPLEAQIMLGAGLVVAPSADDLRHELEQLGISGEAVGAKIELGALIVHAMRRRNATRRLSSGTLRRARTAARNRRWSDAIARYGKAIAEKPEDGMRRIQFAHALKESGDDLAALDAYWAAVTYDPLLADAHLELAHALVRMREDASSKRPFLHALQLDPSLGAARRGLQAFGVDAAGADAFLRGIWLDADDLPTDRGDRSGSGFERSGSRDRAALDVPKILAPRERKIWLDLHNRLAPCD